MTQTNVGTYKSRDIRPPHGWKAPMKELVPKGKTMCLTVRLGQPGRCIMVNHPEASDLQFAVNVPKEARVGRKMLVPVPPVGKAVPAKGKGKSRGGGGSHGGSGGGGGRGSGGGDAKPEPLAAAVPPLVLLACTPRSTGGKLRGRCLGTAPSTRLKPSAIGVRTRLRPSRTGVRRRSETWATGWKGPARTSVTFSWISSKPVLNGGRKAVKIVVKDLFCEPKLQHAQGTFALQVRSSRAYVPEEP